MKVDFVIQAHGCPKPDQGPGTVRRWTRRPRASSLSSPLRKQAAAPDGRAAEADNKSLSEFVIGSAAVAAEHVLADRRWFTVDDATWRAFEELLERPAVYNPRLAELLAMADRFVY